MSTEIRILFVDDEVKILDGLRRMLRPMRREWDMAFANSGSEALEMLERERRDVMVSDIRMPNMTGVELMEEVRRRYPHMIRIALSGQASRDTVLSSVGPTHQYLPKPCDAETLKATLGRLGMLRKLLAVDELRGVITAIESLPCLPSLYNELTEELRSSDASVISVAQTISKDITMSGKVLQLVSSGFLGQSRNVHDPAEAVTILGLQTIKPLVLSFHVFSQFDQKRMESFPVEDIWRHSVAVAALAKQIASAEHANTDTVGWAFLAGLLHDVGKIVFADQLAEDYQSAIDLADSEGIVLLEAERRTFQQATHAEVGAYLLGVWGIPDPIIEAVAFHHDPSRSCKTDQFTALTAVHVANALIPRTHRPSSTPVDSEYLAKLGLGDRLTTWTEVCQDPTYKEIANV